jgi:hypothetical protein
VVYETFRDLSAFSNFLGLESLSTLSVGVVFGLLVS